jgi:hypothetical protein
MSYGVSAKKRLDQLFESLLDTVEFVRPELYQRYSHLKAFVTYLKRLDTRTALFLHKQCEYYARNGTFEYDLDETHNWLLQYRVVTALNMYDNLQERPPGSNDEAVFPICSDDDLLAWLLIYS